MNYAIIAAGNGSRLAQEGVSLPKPLVRAQGECLIERLLRIFSHNDAENIFVICNEEMTDVADYIRSCQKDYPVRLLVKSTPSSMHSLHELSQMMRKEMKSDKFILTTVDTIFNEQEFADFVFRFANDAEVDSLMGLTTFVDDEKPLYVAVTEAVGQGSQSRITGYFDSPNNCKHISAGIYGLRTSAFSILDGCIESGKSRMRNFQRALVESRLLIQPFVFSEVFDVDHVSDIEKANDYLAQNNESISNP